MKKGMIGMKAWVLHDIGDLRYEDVDMPEIKENEVLVAVKAAGICGSDIPRVYQTGAHKMPLIPGHEFSGEVVQIGKKVDSAWMGARVGIFPLIPCKECEPCKKKLYEMCRNYSYIGSRQDGAFAEYVAVPEWNLIRLPEGVSYEAAAMLEPMAVAVHAMRRIEPKTEDTVVVCGLGTIGMLLLMFLLDAGIKNVLAVGNKEFQKEIALQLGLDKKQYCDGKTQDVTQWILEQTNGKGADAFFECVGKNETVVQAVDSTAFAGKICLVGNPYSDMQMEKNVYWKILRNQLVVAGTWNSSFMHEVFDDWHYVLERISRGRIKPEKMISHTYEMSVLKKGMFIMRDKTEGYIKIIGSKS